MAKWLKPPKEQKIAETSSSLSRHVAFRAKRITTNAMGE